MTVVPFYETNLGYILSCTLPPPALDAEAVQYVIVQVLPDRSATVTTSRVAPSEHLWAVRSAVAFYAIHNLRAPRRRLRRFVIAP